MPAGRPRPLYEPTCGQRWLLHLWEQAPHLARPVQRLYRMHPGLDTAAFPQALQQLVDRHPALRLQLVRKDDRWMQRFPVRHVFVKGDEITGRSPGVRASYVAALAAQEAHATLDLRKDKAVKARLFKTDDEYLLSLCVDHAAADETAFDLMERNLLSAYEELCDGKESPPPPEDGFYDYLSRETAQKAGEDAHLAYWKEELTGAPAQGARKEGPDWAPASVWEHRVDGDALGGLLNFCRTNKCSLFHVVLACQLLLLSEAGGGEDLVINLPVSNRVRAADRSIVGNLSMLLHVRFRLEQGEPPAALVLRIRDGVLRAMAHRQYDYPALSKHMAAEWERRGAAGNWLLGCNFISDPAPLPFPNALFAERLDKLPGRAYDLPAGSLTVVARQTVQALHLDVDWDASAWPFTTASMQATFTALLGRFMI